MKYGIIGNCKTAALIDDKGSIEWMCLPVFDSHSCFARILDPEGGHFSVSMDGPCRIRQRYLPKSNILETEYDDGANVFQLLDYMPRFQEETTVRRPLEVHRILKPIRGKPRVRVEFRPKLNYAQDETSLHAEKGFVIAENNLESLFLYSNIAIEDVLAERGLVLEETRFFVLTYHEKSEAPHAAYCQETLERTHAYWQRWASHCKLPKLYQEASLRSALTLKLLTYDVTGAIVAAATTSLPEIAGGNRNWDYRFCWLRDSSLMLEALKILGHFEEARDFIHFLLRLFESKRTKVQIMYGIDGRTNLEEYTLPHLRGYKDSAPVRIGNFAAHTKQNDIFGEVLNTLHLYYMHYKFEKMTDEVWSLVKFLVDTTVREWATEDAGIWELRHIKGHFTFSKMLSWVALDRGIRIAQALGKDRSLQNWLPVRDQIRHDIETYGFNQDAGAFTQSYGSSYFDASLFLMHHYGFLEADDPKWIATVKNCDQHLVRNGFSFRYTNADDFGKPHTAFIVASFWLCSALVSIGDRERAVEIFENVLNRANPLGLLSEDIDPVSHELLGNFPQAYSHMALINAAYALSN